MKRNLLRFFFLVSFLCINSSFCFSQNVVLKYLPTNKDSVINYVKAASEKTIKSCDKKYKDEVKKIISERRGNFIKDIEDSTYIFDDNISKYLKSILNEIYASNPAIDSKDFYFFVDKSTIPNAACYGDGIFTLNLGLFNFVDSDDELAFIFCHEIAHYALAHNQKNLLTRIEKLKSKDTKKEIRKVNNQTYGKRKLYGELVEKLSYNFSKRNRASEVQADSLGLIFFGKTKFNKLSSVSALRKLEASDSIVFNENARIKEHFNFEKYPFKENWLLKDQPLFDVKEVSDDYSFNKDSLRTHPDMGFRIAILNKMIADKKEAVTSSIQKLNEIKHLVGLAIISNCINEKRVDLALYYTLVLFDKKEIDESTYCLLVGQLLQKVYELKANHTFGRYVTQISPFSDEENLNQVKLFLHNTELKNIRKIGLNFCEKYQERMKNDIDFKKTIGYFNKLNIN